MPFVLKNESTRVIQIILIKRTYRYVFFKEDIYVR